jgi:integrase
MPGFLLDLLRTHRGRLTGEPAPGALVFPTRLGTPVPRSNFRREVWTPALGRAGPPAMLRFHDLRHSYATWLVTDGVPVNAVQWVMGHASASTTLDRYTHAPADYANRVRDAFAANADDSLTLPAEEPPEDDDDGGAALLVPA